MRGYKLMGTSEIPFVDTSNCEGPGLRHLKEPLFSAKDVELNAAMLMRFLQQNCTKEGATYLLQREPVDNAADESGVGETGGSADSPRIDCVRLYGEIRGRYVIHRRELLVHFCSGSFTYKFWRLSSGESCACG